jgi:hypothetical protein
LNLEKNSLKLFRLIPLVILSITWGCNNLPTNNNTTANKPVKTGTSSGNSATTTPISTTNNITINDEQAIRDALSNNPELFPLDVNGDEEENQATVPNNGGVVFATVPNNGGVVFVAESEKSGFNTKATGPNDLRPKPDDSSGNVTVSDAVRNKAKNRLNRLKDLVPANWSKKLIGEPKRTVDINFDSRRTKAEVKVKTEYERELLFRKDNSELKKRIKEKSEIKAIFIKQNNKWEIEQISPTDLEIDNVKANLSLESVSINVTDKDKTQTTTLDLSSFKNKNSLISLTKGDILTIEVKATNKDETFDPPIHVFVRIPDTKQRVPLFDDGSQSDLQPLVEGLQVSGDKIMDDDIYSANIAIKPKSGINHLTIDLVAGGSFDNNANSYNSISKSIPIIIK